MNKDLRLPQRLQIARSGKTSLNGIDYLEVLEDGHTLHVYLLKSLAEPETLRDEQIQIFRGDRRLKLADLGLGGRQLRIRLAKPLDGAIYTLELVNRESIELFDPYLSKVNFTVNGAVSCGEPLAEQPKDPDPPVIDYLAKDYASFRQLMLDRLTVTLPQWKERSPADLGIMLVELLAYVGDNLSYHQDAVATEAYLGTARQRMSIRRHARLLDYYLHQGCNARVWLALAIEASLDGQLIGNPSASPVQFFSQIQGLPTDEPLSEDEFRQALTAKAQVFEPLEALRLYLACNQLHFHTWGEAEYTLPIGATHATFKDPNRSVSKALTSGRVLILEEALNPQNGKNSSIDRTHRHAVRLTKVTPTEDPLFGEAVVNVTWHREDALPFALCLAKVMDRRPRTDLAIARGNVLLADQGRTVPRTPLTETEIEQPPDSKINLDIKILDEEKLNPLPSPDIPYRPYLKKTGEGFPLTYQGYLFSENQRQWLRFDPSDSATSVFHWEMWNTRPAITLQQGGIQDFTWTVQRDLLNSDRFARDFVVEVADNQQAFLRFGNDDFGKRPESGTDFRVIYRVGNGTSGNVGAEAIVHWIGITGLKRVYNPLPGQGGTEPEPINRVRLEAPQAFRIQQRAVTPDDYAQKAMEYPEVQRAIATRHWTGSGYTILIAVDRQGGKPLDEGFKAGLCHFLEPFRMAGQEIGIIEPLYVPLEIALTVQIKEGYYQSAILQALLTAFVPPSGFFAPDRLTFGQGIYASEIIQQAMQVEGVSSTVLTRFQRRGTSSGETLKQGKIAIASGEIARLDNEPSLPQNGLLNLLLEGGL